MSSKFERALLISLLLSILIAGIFEIALLLYAYLNADRVECNLLYCSFIQERRNVTQTINITKECYLNGVKVDCNELNGEWK
jgi:hypothetical protein